MSDGVSRRSQIDTELGKGLLLMHGGGSIALLAFLPTILQNPDYLPLSKAILWGAAAVSAWSGYRNRSVSPATKVLSRV